MSKTVVHLITGLGKGGAETMLYQVLKYRQNQDFNYKIISLGGAHYYEEPMRELGYKVIELDFRRRPLSGFIRLCRELRGADTLCCWMYHANLIGYLAARKAGVDRVVWCVRHSNLDSAINKARTLRINQICARWSKNVSAILYNGNRARATHEAAGYCCEKGVVVDNGCDCEEYRPNENVKNAVCKEFSISEEKKIIVTASKNAPGKGLDTYLRALRLAKNNMVQATALMCGHDVNSDNYVMIELCDREKLRVGEDVILAGMRHDVPMLLAACDLFVLPEDAAAFPNVLLQAMACGCVCVTTDVGDARRILNNDACVVPPGEPEALAGKITELLALPKETADDIRRGNRARVQENFDIREIVKQYEEQF